MGQHSLLMLPDNWPEFKQKCEDVGLEPLRIIAAKYGRDRGDFTDDCEYIPDTETWNYYQSLENVT